MSADVMTIPTGTSNSDDLSEQRSANDVELRELVYQSLERDGLITRIKAQLRAAVFKTIDKATNSSVNNPHPPINDGMNGRLCRALVLDWLEHSRLLYTEDVFKTETTGPNHPAPLTRDELLEQLHMKLNQNNSQSILHTLLEQNTNRTPTTTTTTTTTLPDHIKQSIDTQFPNERITDHNRIRDHFRSLFSPAFDTTVLDAFINKNLSLSSSTSLPKYTYEDVCLKWIQACSKVLVPQPTTTTTTNKQNSTTTSTPIPALVKPNPVNNGQTVNKARRATSPPTDSSESSSESASSDNQRKPTYDFPLPTTLTANKSVIKKSTDAPPPPLIDFGEKSTDEEEETSGSASLFSKRNATPEALNRLKNIDNIIQGGGNGDQTPRTRTVLQKSSNNGTKDLPVEYDDESMSQSVSHSIISSVDDVTVDKASPSPSATMDFFEDL